MRCSKHKKGKGASLADPASSRNRIEHLYSLAATVFPLGIKMQMVRELCLLTNTNMKAKSSKLVDHPTKVP